MGHDFCHAAEGLLSPHGSANPTGLWAALDTGHFDLNSCLRESMILLKCFLRAMPNQQLYLFQKTVAAHMMRANPASPAVAFRVRDCKMSAVVPMVRMAASVTKRREQGNCALRMGYMEDDDALLQGLFGRYLAVPSIQLARHYFVALASRLFQSVPVINFQIAAPVSNQAALL
jgi:hypothetical protein